MLSKEAWLWVKVNLSKNNTATFKLYYLRPRKDYQWCEHRCEHIFKMKAMLYRVAPWVRYIWV